MSAMDVYFFTVQKVKTVQFRKSHSSVVLQYPLVSCIAVVSRFPTIPERGGR